MIHCSRCGSSGFIVATHRENGGFYSFCCTCEIPAKKGITKTFPVWKSEYLKTYIPDREREFISNDLVKIIPVREKPDLRKLAANDKDDPEPEKIDEDDCPF